jgi:gliding motility-associated-like protein
VWVYPFTNTNFTFEPETVVVTNTVTFSDQTQLNGNAATGWEWSFGDGQTSNEQNPQHSYAAPGTYQVCLSVITEFGCTQQFCDSVTVIPAELELPNIVTPNDDGVNDLLQVKYLEFYPNNQIKVYNRWGNIVFEKKNYANDWSPKNVSDGVYFYVVSIEGGKEYSEILHVAK